MKRSGDPAPTSHSFTAGKFTVTPMVRAIPNGEWLSKASTAQADNTPAEAHVQTANRPFVGETDAMAGAEQEARSLAMAVPPAA